MLPWLLLLFASRCRGSLHSLQISDGSRAEIVARLKEAQLRCPEFRVLDVGAAMNPWSIEVVSAVADRSPESVADCFQCRGRMALLARWLSKSSGKPSEP